MSPAVTAPGEASKVRCSSGMRTTITPPPNGPRNPPRYSAACASRSRRPSGAAAHEAGGGRSGAMRADSVADGRRRAAVSGPAARPKRSRRATCVVGHPDRRIGHDEQRRGAPRRRPGVARGVEGVVDPGRRTVARVTRRPRRASSERSAVGAEKVRNGGRTGRPRAGTRCSSALSSQPLHHTRSNIRARARRCPDAVAEIRCEHAVHADPGPGRRCRGFEPEQRDHPVDVDEQQRFVAGMCRFWHGCARGAAPVQEPFASLSRPRSGQDETPWCR